MVAGGEAFYREVMSVKVCKGGVGNVKEKALFILDNFEDEERFFVAANDVKVFF